MYHVALPVLVLYVPCSVCAEKGKIFGENLRKMENSGIFFEKCLGNFKLIENAKKRKRESRSKNAKFTKNVQKLQKCHLKNASQNLEVENLKKCTTRRQLE